MLGDLLYKYVQNPAQDWRPSLIIEAEEECYPKEVLQRLQSAVETLAEDLAYIIRHPKRFDARRAPPVAHRMRELKVAKDIENMVVRLRSDGQMADGALAKQCLGRITAAGRKFAKEARQLAFYREGLQVKFHKSFGQKKMRQEPPPSFMAK